MIGITNVVNKKASEVEMVNLTLQTDQSSHTVLNGVNFTLSYGNYTKSYTWNGSAITIEVPAYLTYTITFGGVANYTTPAAITYTAQTGNSRTVNAVYTIQKETVTVKCSGLSSGFTLTVKNADTGATIGSQTTTSKNYQIPAGTKYYVTASTVSGYNKPANSSTYTAVANGTRTVTMTYTVAHEGTKDPTNGVWIQDTDGYCHTVSAWSGKYTPNGVAVIASRRRFVIALEDATSKRSWGNYILIPNGTVTTDKDVAKADYNGEGNTNDINNLLDSMGTFSPAYYCARFKFPDGSREGYLGAAGEWNIVIENKDSVNDALAACGKSNILVKNTMGYWTSTQYDGYSVWAAECINMSPDILYVDKMNATLKVRAFRRLQL